MSIVDLVTFDVILREIITSLYLQHNLEKFNCIHKKRDVKLDIYWKKNSRIVCKLLLCEIRIHNLESTRNYKLSMQSRYINIAP